ncbi:estradiol 17-beta-dehydrogenase 11-like [Haematobia irritans]|uniref:estradiol 17-beta-dehydrogenase 11-like n=1 Tax=Haematobia irritans TaxID=7368 RepID=UPI003F5057E2
MEFNTTASRGTPRINTWTSYSTQYIRIIYLTNLSIIIFRLFKMFKGVNVIAFVISNLPLAGLILAYPFFIVASIVYGVVKLFKRGKKRVSLINEVAVITGSARGLGREIAIQLAKRGCRLAIVDVQQTLAEETAEHISKLYDVKTKAYKVDISDYKQVIELQEKVTNDLGDTTILVNNAGILMLSRPENPPLEEVSRMINVNISAVCYTTQIFLPKMKELNRGHIVNISSASALLSFPTFGIYAATKVAVRRLTSMLRMEMMVLGHNITATTVMPTFLNTNEHVQKLVRLTQCLRGDIAANQIVQGMLAGQDELVIPSTATYMYILLEMLPTYIKERFVSLILGNSYQKYVKSSKVRNVLKEGSSYLDIVNNNVENFDVVEST